jgi:hypothetical protein
MTRGSIQLLSRDKVPLYSKLLSSVFKKNFYNERYFYWQYFENPYGDAVGLDYIVEGRVVAHYACIPIQIGSNAKLSLLSLNTATDPEFQGQGLFKELALTTFDLSVGSFASVMGVANSKSFPGFMKHLSFQHLGSLNLRYGKLISPHDVEQSVIYTAEFLDWRISSPRGGLKLIQDSNGTLVSKKVTRLGPTLHQYVALQQNRNVTRDHSLSRVRSRKALTIDWHSMDSPGKSIYLPEFLKPSPLNLIWRNLGNSGSQKPDYVSFLDFDAF